MNKLIEAVCAQPFVAFFLVSVAFAQLMEGELRVTILDPSGRGVPAHVELTSRNPQFHAEGRADSQGRARLQRLPQGVYRLAISYAGFEEFSDTVEVRSAVPQTREVRLIIGPVTTQVTVQASGPLMDIAQPELIMQAGRKQLDETLGTTLGRSLTDVITTMPGWLLEANAVLHPRGSEYDTQYVIDGMPLYDNRSLAFAPAFENNEFEAVNILTASIPAEYGRRLGGVIALDTRRVSNPGHSSEIDFQTGSYGTYMGSAGTQYRSSHTGVSMGIHAGHTDRYLDPPSLENFTNKASSAGVDGRLDRDLSERDQISVYFRWNRTGFLVPNDLVQEAAGQRQDHSTEESAGLIQYQHTFSSDTLGSVRGMARDLSARLWSNTLSTPVYVDQDRGFREAAINGSLAIETRDQTLKFGGDFRMSNIRESFRLAEPDAISNLLVNFDRREESAEASAFIQDHVRLGNFAAQLGLRVDHYRLLISDTAVSPRVGLSYYVPKIDLLLRAAYDRVFQPPPTENLLLSSATGDFGLGNVEGTLPIPTNRGNFFEVGLRKPVGNHLRADINHYWRTFRNFIDDDVFLNTGISLPITFDTARIQGTEVRLEMPRWHNISSFGSYSNMVGTASSPVTGGLFIHGGEASGLRSIVQRFPITQDQRNTVAAQVQFEPHPKFWIMMGVRYGSGLPVELEDENEGSDSGPPAETIPPAILEKVNLERGRLSPNFSLDFAARWQLWERERQSLSLQFDVRNATDRLNVINFTGLFSGTALAPGRQFTLQIKTRF